jgi:hypothetical protein
MSAADERYMKGSLCSPYAGGAYAYLDPNRAGPLHAYALGYLEAAITLGESAIRRPSDLAFYPLLHLFRHGVELALKQLAYDIAKYKGESEGPTLDHLIAGLWRQLKPDLDQWIESRRYGGEAPPESTEFDDIVADLVCVEPTGFPSRYPTTRQGTNIHPPLSTVDFGKFLHAVRRSESTLRTWMHELSADASFQADYLAERRRTRDERAGD